MILLLDTSTSLCQLTLAEAGVNHQYSWQADRQLAKGLLKFIVDSLAENKLAINQLEGLVFMKGPGSFTGLRIGATVLNTIAEFEGLPIVAAAGPDWQAVGLELLKSGQNQQLIIPDYGRDARITTPRK